MQDPNGVDQSGLKPPIQIPQSPIQNPNPPSKSPNPQSKIQIPHPNPPPVQIPHPNPPSKSASSIPATCGRKLGTDFRREVLLENELRFPAPCRGNRGSISGETTGQVVLLKPLSVDIARRRPCVKNCKHRVASTVCPNARDVNIAWHRGLSTIPDPMQHFACGHRSKALNIMQQSSCFPVGTICLGS